MCSSRVPDFLARKYTEQRREQKSREQYSRADQSREEKRRYDSREQQSRTKLRLENGKRLTDPDLTVLMERVNLFL